MSDIIEEVKRTPMKHRQKVNFVILGLVILASGFALGTSSTFSYLRSQDRIRPKVPIIQFGDPNGRRPDKFDPVEKWAAQYKFTDEQRELAKAAMERQHKEFREMFVDGQKKMEAAKDLLVKDMNDILTPEQFSPWHEDFKERLKRRGRGRGRSFRSERGGPPGSRGPGRPPKNKGDAPPGDGHKNRDRDGDTSTEASPK